MMSAVTDEKRMAASAEVVSDIQLVAKLLRGFADPTRLAILVHLADCELRVTDLQARVGGSQGNVSGHLACLKDCGLVADRPEGRAVWYRIAEPEVIAVIRAAEALLACTGERVALCPNYRSPKRRS